MSWVAKANLTTLRRGGVRTGGWAGTPFKGADYAMHLVPVLTYLTCPALHLPTIFSGVPADLVWNQRLKIGGFDFRCTTLNSWPQILK